MGMEEIMKNSILSSKSTVEEKDEFEIPTLVLCRTPNPEEMKRRRKISSLRKQYGVRIDNNNSI